MCGGKVAIPPIVKEKRRNSEKRKEKSRDAARCRRSKESEIFSDMANQLPLPQILTLTLDKASIMRLAVEFLKVKQMVKIIPSSDSTSLAKCVKISIPDSWFSTVLNGFLLVLSDEGDITFISGNVDEIIGMSQIEMMGHSIYEFSHPCDHDEIKACLAAKAFSKLNDDCKDERVSVFIRMKTTFKQKGRAVNLKSAAYQVIHYIGRKRDNPGDGKTKCPLFYLLLIGETIPNPVQIDMPLDKDVFVSRHSPDMKFTHIDEKITEFLGYRTAELLGQSVYIYHHALDASCLLTTFKALFQKGQIETGHYRFLAKHGGYVWVVTQATLIGDNAAKPECVVCLNYVLSKVENQHEIVSIEQEPIKEAESPPTITEVEGPPLAKPPVLLSSTRAIFAPKETVMSKDFLNFPDTDILLFQDPLKEPKLSLDDFFGDDPCTIGSTVGSNLCDDPFIVYRDDSLSSPSYCGTPESSLNLHPSNSTSPNHFSTTPSTPESGSLSDLPSLDPIDEFSDLKFTTMPPSVSDKDSDYNEEENLDYRAPFISMNMDDDFALISPSSSVMWGPQEPAPKKAIPESKSVKNPLKEPNFLPAKRMRTMLPDPEPQRISPPNKKPITEANMQSSLAALLRSDIKKAPQTKEKGAAHRKDTALHKRWQNTSSQGIPSPSDSVLLNLLISGEDASRGYLCSGNSRYSENKYQPTTLSLPSIDTNKATDSSSNCTELLTSESELLDSFLKISQYDADLNAPIQSAHLLQGDDLLSALDHPLLRNVPAMV